MADKEEAEAEAEEAVEAAAVEAEAAVTEVEVSSEASEALQVAEDEAKGWRMKFNRASIAVRREW